LPECLQRLRSAWEQRDKRARPGFRRGFGLACAGHISGILSSGAIVRILEDGTVMLNTGSVDIGQGSDTALSQICAGALKVPIEQVSIASPDTDGSPYNWGTTASRVTYMTGRAVVGAAKEVEKQLMEHAGEMLECEVADLELREGGLLGVKGVPDKEVSFRDVSLRTHWKVGGPIVGSHTWVYDKPTIDPKRALITGSPFANTGAFSFGAMIVSVEVDETTGQTQIDEVWAAVDVGTAINPQSVEGQIQGGFAQGMGFALTEEMVWDGGRLANPSMMDYKAPTSLDTPYKIHSYIVEKPHPDGPFGAKGVGEIPLVTVAAAVANAIADATGGRLRKLPMTPERVFETLEDDYEA
jgi:CO/xanthine dehydrogenase Mo-binding subunit